jgi:hypothetical protein
MRLLSINITNPYPENIERNILKMIIHLSGKRADVFGYIIQVNEPTNEIIRGIFRITFLDFIKPITPVGNNMPHITRNKTLKFNELYDC